jgi:hypothetical protein
MTGGRSSQLPVVVVLIGALLASAFARSSALGQRRDLDESRNQSAGREGGNVSQLNSFALGLLLGGLRGPMLMALWTSSENQKTERELDDFDTKVELIRLLQAEFDGVHLFQIWNKAYNISVQMANVSTKYTTILDAMDYAYSVDAERPDNVNIIAAIAGLYFDKFGNAAEKGYFSPRLRDETLPIQDRVRVKFPAAKRDLLLRQARLAGAPPYVLQPRELDAEGARLYIQVRPPVAEALRQRFPDAELEYEVRPVRVAGQQQVGARRTEHEPVLDEQYHILPQFLAARPSTQPTGDGADGSRLPYLAKFQPYPYGVSPFALGYNYYKRAQFLQQYRGLVHAQLSDRVVSSRPALSLKKWSEEDWYAARRAEIELFLPGQPVPREEAQLERPTAAIPLAAIARTPLLDEVVHRYRKAYQVAVAAVEEYRYHLKSFPEDLTYFSHLEGSEAQSKLMMGDALFLEAMIAPTDLERRRLAGEAADWYRQAADLYSRHIFKYFMGDEDAPSVLPPRVQRHQVSDKQLFPEALVPLAMAKLRARHAAANNQLGNSEDFLEIDGYVQRANARIATINAMTK